ncbi:hypothetical protein FCV52_20820 [Vibrio kanaloae]|uniref:Uncharacterized protein n=1 Tax=Vibrio kanaloae TaxID=170673 RepID=A0A4U1YLG0_9VIBR|nr:hypothetical protein FCV52_20820 [Vibrio kanaloae]
MQTNAALSGEQRRPPHLTHCAVNTKFKANLKCRALGIRLKCLVSCSFLVAVLTFVCTPLFKD